MDKRVLEAMDGVRKAVRLDAVQQNCDPQTKLATASLYCVLMHSGVGVERSEQLAKDFREAQRELHRVTQRIFKAVEG